MIDLIDLKRPLRTRNRCEVKIYHAVQYSSDAGGSGYIHGAILTNGKWRICEWNQHGLGLNYWDDLVNQPNPSPFKPGDIVKLSGQYQPMTVEQVHSSGSIQCVWFTNPGSPSLMRGQFSPGVLVKA